MKWVLPITLLFTTLYFGLFVHENVSYLKSSCIDNFDRELLAVGVEAAKRGDALTGAYSRFGFRHPGPFLFYYLASFEALILESFSPNGAYRLGALVLNLGAILLATFAISRTLKLGVLSLLLFPAVLLSVPSEIPYLADYWNPRPVTSLYLLLIGSSAASFREIKWLPVATFALFACSHLHVGSVLGLIPLGGLVAALLLKCGDLKIKVICSLVAAIFVLPTSIDAIVSNESFGNLGSIIAFGSTSRWSHTYGEVYELVGSYFKTVLPFLPRFFAIVVILTGAALGSQKLGIEGRRIFLISLSSLPFAALGAYKIHGPLHQYLLSFAHGTVALLVALSLCLLVSLGAKVFKIKEVTIGVLLGTAILFLNLPLTLKTKECSSLINVPRYLDALNPDKHVSYRLNIGELESRFAPKIVLGFLERGVNVCVNRDVKYIFGEGLVCDDNEKHQDIWLLPKGAKMPIGASTSFEGTRSVLWW